MRFYVYILVSVRSGRTYTGQSQDYVERLRRHNAGREKSTKAFGPWELAVLITCNTRVEAINIEMKLKKLKSRKLLFDHAFRSGGVAGPGWSEALLQ